VAAVSDGRRVRIILELGTGEEPVADHGGTLAVAALRWMDRDASLEGLRRVFAGYVQAMHPEAAVRALPAPGAGFSVRIDGAGDAEADELAGGIEEMLASLVRTATEWRVMLN